jgi:BAI1-associated protein 3
MYSLSLPKQAVRLDGAVVIFSVWHHDDLLPNDFLGEIVIRLNEVDTLRRSIDDMPVYIMSLRRPRELTCGPMQVTLYLG